MSRLLRFSLAAFTLSCATAGSLALAQQAMDTTEEPLEAAAAGKPETPIAAGKAAPDAEGKPTSAPVDTKPKDYTILKLGAEEIKYSEAEELWKGLFPGGAAPDFNTFDETVRQNVLRGIVSERLIYQEASKEGFEKSPEVQKRLESLKKQLIMQAYMEAKAKALVSEEQMKKAYAEKIATMKDEEEVRARHILVASEDEAKKLSKDLKKGGDFEKVAKEKSQDKGSGTQGGDLGYFTKDKMVPEFAEAAFKLKVGDISEPVKSSFGWHIIKVEDRRKVKVPGFEEMRDEIQAEISAKAVQDYVETLLKKADIKYYAADGKEKTFSRSLQEKK